MAKQFGNIPTTKKSIVIAVIEVLSQKIIVETDEKLAAANQKLLRDVRRHHRGYHLRMNTAIHRVGMRHAAQVSLDVSQNCLCGFQAS